MGMAPALFEEISSDYTRFTANVAGHHCARSSIAGGAPRRYWPMSGGAAPARASCVRRRYDSL